MHNRCHATSEPSRGDSQELEIKCNHYESDTKAFVEGLSPIFRDGLRWRFAGRMLEKAEQSADDEDTAAKAFKNALETEKWLFK